MNVGSSMGSGIGGMGPGMGGMGMGSMGNQGNYMNHMSQMGRQDGMGGMCVGNMGGVGGSSAEKEFFSALEASGVNNAQITLLLPQEMVYNVLIPRGIMAEIAQKSGSKIDLAENRAGMTPTTLTGTMMANSLAALYLQDAALEFQ